MIRKVKHMLRRFKKYKFIIQTEFIPIISIGIGYNGIGYSMDV